MKRQEESLEATAMGAFSKVTLVLFLMYNALTSSVFGIFACQTMDFGDKFNRFELGLDCETWSHKAVWVTLAKVCLALYPIGNLCDSSYN